MHRLLPASVALALAAAPLGALADDPAPDLRALRDEIEALKSSYEARLQALEARLKAAEAAAAAQAAAPPPPPPAAAAAPAAGAPATPGGGGANAFNPALSLILSGLYARTTQDPADYAITGFPLPADVAVGPGTRGFSLAESELGFAANIDPWLRGAANIALEPDNTVAVEEAFIQTTSLGGGFSLKAGRFFSSIGYLNPQHSHTWDFVDNPLAYQGLLGTQYGDDGLQLTWIAPIDQYVELGAEVGRGRSYPGTDSGRNGPGMAALIAHVGGDVGDSSSWRAGLSVLDAKADSQSLLATAPGGRAITDVFSGSTRVYVVDAVWKWAPHGNAVRTHFKLQGEYLRGRRDGTLVDDAFGRDVAGAYRITPSGWYLQAVYQFVPHWRVGLRTEALDAGRADYAPAALGGDGFRPRRDTLMVDFSPSEFSRVRLQFARDRAREGFPDNELFLQYQTSLGAHGAHTY